MAQFGRESEFLHANVLATAIRRISLEAKAETPLFKEIGRRSRPRDAPERSV